MKNKLRCPNCNSLKLRSNIKATRSFAINENGECKFGKKNLDESAFDCYPRIYCGKCYKGLKYSDGILEIVDIKEYGKNPGNKCLMCGK